MARLDPPSQSRPRAETVPRAAVLLAAVLLGAADAAHADRPPVPDYAALLAQGECSQPGTEAQFSSCVAQVLRSEDARLNAVYRQAMATAKGRDAAQAEKLRDAQRAWISFRDAHCAWVTDAYRGGSRMGAVQDACLALLTRQRIGEIAPDPARP